MNQSISTLVYTALMPIHLESENSCVFSLPFIFRDGTPVSIQVQRLSESCIKISDDGRIISDFCTAYDVSVDEAAQIFSVIEVESSVNVFKDDLIHIECLQNDLTFVLLDLFEFFGRLVAFQKN